MTQGGHEDDVLDLDDDTPVPLEPKRVAVFGRVWTVRRDWTAQDAVSYWVLAHKRQDVRASCLLVGDEDGPAFAEIIAALPLDGTRKVDKLRRLLQVAGLLDRDEADGGTQGKSSVTSPPPEDAGATPSSPTADGTTTAP